MAYKILGALVSDPSDSNIGLATAVACTLASTQTITVKESGGGAVGTISLPAGVHKVNKQAAQTLAFTGSATAIAHSD
jgi:type II secretory pathway component HofQ